MRQVFSIITILFMFGSFMEGFTTPFLDNARSRKMNCVTLLKNKPFDEQITQKNTIYKIRYNYDLEGDTIVIPSGCILQFKRGRLTNGTIVLNNTYIEGNKSFHNIVLTGKCSNNRLSSEVFVLDKNGQTDNSVDVQSLFNIGVDTICFCKGIYSFSNIHVGNVIVKANGSIFVSTLASEDYAVINSVFSADGTDYFKLYDATIQGRKNGSSLIGEVVLSPIDLTRVGTVEINGCIFKELRYSCYNSYDNGLYDYRGVALSCHGCKNVLVENCEFYDICPSEWIWIAPTVYGTWNDVNNVCIKNNYFHNPADDFERSNTPVNVFSKNVLFEGNLLEYQKYAGSAFNLQSRNVIVRGNVVRNSYFKSVVDVCEYGDFCNDYVHIYNNDFSAYNSQGVVANAKELIVKNNRFQGISAVLAYATYYNPEVKHSECIDYANQQSMPNQKVIIEGNICNCDYIDTEWQSDGEIIHGGYSSGFTIQSLYCISDSIRINDNHLYIRNITSSGISKQTHQPIFIRNAKNIDIRDNYLDSDIPAMGSKYKGAIYIMVYNRNRGKDAKLTNVESVNIINNSYDIKSNDNILYPVRISGYSDNIADWKIDEFHLVKNAVIGPSKRTQIYTTDGSIDDLTIIGDMIDINNSPAKINQVRVLR